MNSSIQGRRRVLKSGTAIERHRRSARAEGSSGRGGGSTRGGYTPSRKGASGDLPRVFFLKINMSVAAILIHFNTIYAGKIRLIVQAFHVAVFKCVSKIEQLF